MLLKASVPHIEYDECIIWFKDLPHIIVSESQLCAGGQRNDNSRTDSCYGDSG